MRGGRAMLIGRTAAWPGTRRARPDSMRGFYAPVPMASTAGGRHICPVPTTPQGTVRWARLRRDVRSVLRRGAWYRVVSLGPEEAVLDVDNASVRVAREVLEVTETRPTRWTIVPRPRDAEKLPEAWGEFYAVCPNCAARAPVG